VKIDDQNRIAVQSLLFDADRAVALTEVEDAGGGRSQDVAPQMVATAYKNYIDPVRRSRPLVMTDAELMVFHRKLDRLRACLRFFGEAL